MALDESFPEGTPSLLGLMCDISLQSIHYFIQNYKGQSCGGARGNVRRSFMDIHGYSSSICWYISVWTKVMEQTWSADNTSPPHPCVDSSPLLMCFFRWAGGFYRTASPTFGIRTKTHFRLSCRNKQPGVNWFLVYSSDGSLSGASSGSSLTHFPH